MIITIAGHNGAGKSTLAKNIASHYQLEKFSSGDFFRQIARERGITLAELGVLADNDGGEVDFMVEERARILGQEKTLFCIDGRLPYWVIPHGFSVFLNASLEVSAERIYSEDRTHEKFASLSEACDAINKRRHIDSQRYQNYYGVDLYDLTQYDLVIDTDNLSSEDVVSHTTTAIDIWVQQGVQSPLPAPEAYFAARQKYLGY